ncbi:hypothetical protein F4777DRAFT_565034 [Nemania sp. FL0916]|nr:hypothetical protein F4777DRAFT_565034 [Nemania sp. FL0916]
MSGFEIAGIVLGAIPLVISALEHYQAGIGVISSIMKWEGLLDDLLSDLKLEKILFYWYLVGSLRGANIDELSRTVDPTEEQCIVVLRNAKNSTELTRYLGSQYSTFVDIVKRYERHLGNIAKKLKNFQRPAGAAKTDLAALLDANPLKDGKFHFRDRLTFAISQGSLRTLIKHVREDRKYLKEVAEMSTKQQELVVRQAEADSIKLAEYFSQTQRNAISVFTAFCERYTCGCSSHQIFLRLQHRLPLYTGKGSRSSESNEFNLLVDLGGKFQHLAIETIPCSVGGIDHKRAEAHRTTKVAFKLPAVHIAVPPDQHSKDGQEVTDICPKTNPSYQSGSPLNLKILNNKIWLRNDTSKKQRHYSARKPLNTIFHEAIQDEDAKMTPKQQTMLALDVAASILQLYGTSWCQIPFVSEAIHMFLHPSSTTRTSASEAFVAQVIDRRSASGTSPSGPDPRTATIELAIVLLEIWHQKTFDMWASKAEVTDISSEDGRTAAASKWLRMTSERLPVHHLTAIEQCLALSAGRSWNWSDDEFRARFCENVIKPLDENVKAW